MSLSNEPGNFIRPEDLHTLSTIRSDQSPIFSLYLDLRRGKALDRFDALLHDTEQRRRLDHASHAYREQWAVETDQIRRWFETGKLPHTPALALFSSLTAGLWQVVPIPTPVCDQLYTGDRPNIRPLELLLNTRKENQEPQMETQKVEEIIHKAHKGEGAVLGPEQTFLAVRSKTVRLLVVAEAFCLPGGECPNCGFLGDDERGVCLLCGVALRHEPNIIEVAMQRVLESGGEIAILHSTESRRALEPHGHIGGLVHAARRPVVKDTADQQPITKDGVINRDILHDETIEESFPASDPPGWNH